ncbi:MAG: hypothetical protein ACRDRJ_04630 [Streptosporangiaceae bacterium]
MALFLLMGCLWSLVLAGFGCAIALRTGSPAAVSPGWQWAAPGMVALAIAAVGVLSMSLCRAALRGGPGAGDGPAAFGMYQAASWSLRKGT